MGEFTESAKFLTGLHNGNNKAPYELRDRISYKKKIANNYAWAKAKADYYDGHSMMSFENKRKIKEWILKEKNSDFLFDVKLAPFWIRSILMEMRKDT